MFPSGLYAGHTRESGVEFNVKVFLACVTVRILVGFLKDHLRSPEVRRQHPCPHLILTAFWRGFWRGKGNKCWSTLAISPNKFPLSLFNRNYFMCCRGSSY